MKQKQIENKIRSLLKGHYACHRVWEAWQLGTMTQEDFSPLEEEEAVVKDFVLLLSKAKKQEREKLINDDFVIAQKEEARQEERERILKEVKDIVPEKYMVLIEVALSVEEFIEEARQIEKKK